MRFFIVLIASLLAVTGCSTKPRQGEPAPVISRDGSVSPGSEAPRQEGSVVITPLQAPVPAPGATATTATTTSAVARPAPNRAVELQHERAQAQIDAGDLTAAAKTLERAISIQPDNAGSWNLLAHLRARQQMYAMAAEIAAKSNTMVTPGQQTLKKDNLLLIAKMKNLLGDTAGAARVRQQAMALN